MTAYLSPVFGAGAQLFNNSGGVLNGGKVYTLLAGSYTLVATYTDASQGVANANPIILDSSGRPPNEVWLPGGLQYKFMVTDNLNVPMGYTYDYVSGINDYTVTPSTISEWLLGGTPTYVAATQFSVTGNQTTTYVAGRRIKALVTAGTVYSSISASSYGAGVTTVTVVNDSTGLDSGLSTIYYAIISGTPSSLPSTLVTSSSIQYQSNVSFTTGGASAAYTLTPSPVLLSYVAGQAFDVVFHTTCGATPTININAIGAISLVKASGGTYVALAAGDVTTSWRSQVVLLSPSQALVRQVVASTGVYALLAMANIYTKNQCVTPATLTSGGTIAVDASLSSNFKLVLDTSAVLANPTNMTDGMVLNFRIKQDGTGGRTLTYGTAYTFSGSNPTLSTGANAVDFMSCYYDATDGKLACNTLKGYA